MRVTCALLLVGLLGLACGAGGKPTESASDGEKLATGVECTIAIATCGGGRCTAEIENRCKTPVTCQLKVESLCQTAGGDTGPANASTKHVTQLAGTKKLLDASTSCGQGTPVITKVEALQCI